MRYARGGELSVLLDATERTWAALYHTRFAIGLKLGCSAMRVE